jgi:oxygen-dependent protoporphyrinogen oxidase
LSDELLIARVIAELNVLLGAFATPNDVLVQRWPDRLPQYYLGHENMVVDARAAAATLGVALCGNAYVGVGIPASIGSGRRAGRDALAMLLFSSR